jgi:hypothetical protein
LSRRKDPVDHVVAFFETAPLEQAQTVLTIARGILARRTPKVKAAKPARKGGLLLDGAEVVPPHVKTTKGGLTDEELERR